MSDIERRAAVQDDPRRPENPKPPPMDPREIPDHKEPNPFEGPLRNPPRKDLTSGSEE